jgi:hypothetical protein
MIDSLSQSCKMRVMGWTSWRACIVRLLGRVFVRLRSDFKSRAHRVAFLAQLRQQFSLLVDCRSSYQTSCYYRCHRCHYFQDDRQERAMLSHLEQAPVVEAGHCCVQSTGDLAEGEPLGQSRCQCCRCCSELQQMTQGAELL